jgi:RNA-directed DNA polymerase
MASELELTSDARALALDLFRRELPPLATTECLPFLFGVSPKFIAAMAAPSTTYYRQFALPKRDGSTRLIATPRRFLKLVQRWILGNILVQADVSSSAMGFVRGRSSRDHALYHIGQPNMLSVDIRQFFPSVPQASVTPVFSVLGFPPNVASQLASLCCWRGVLPQGAPTSPCLSNNVFLPIDRALVTLSEEWGARYSRYADDIVVSGSRRFSQHDVQLIARVLATNGFSLHAAKTRIQGRGSRKVVTGFVINVRVQPPRTLRRRWRALFHRAALVPAEYRSRIDELRGICAYLMQSSANEAQHYKSVIELIERSQDGEIIT